LKNADPEELKEIAPEGLKNHRRAEFRSLFRYDVERLVKLAWLRVQREDEIEPTRQKANELLQILTRLRPELERLSRLGDTIDLVARMSTVLQPKAGAPAAGDVATILTQVLDPLRAGEGGQKESYLLQWLSALDSYEVSPPLPRRRTTRTSFARHLAEQAIALFEQRLDERPPASRQHWLGQFLAVLWRDLQQPAFKDGLDLADYFGKKIQEALKRI
jgi:hypothetical protein